MSTVAFRVVRRLVIAGCGLLIVAQGAAAEDLKPEVVRQSIEAGKRFLISQHEPDGSFRSAIGGLYPTGPSAFATLALLNVGMTPQDPPIQKALEFLRSQRPPRKTYEAGLQLMVFAAAKDGNRDVARIDRKSVV